MTYCTLSNAKKIVADKFTAVLNKPEYVGKVSFPTIIWKKMTTIAGKANTFGNYIILNENFLNSRDWSKFLNETPLHELAHIIATKLYGSTGHDKAWRHVCYSIGLNGNRCHTFELPENVQIKRRNTHKYTAYCACMTHTISSCRYKRLQEGTEYVCRHCGKTLSLTTKKSI